MKAYGMGGAVGGGGGGGGGGGTGLGLGGATYQDLPLKISTVLCSGVARLPSLSSPATRADIRFFAPLPASA